MLYWLNWPENWVLELPEGNIGGLTGSTLLQAVSVKIDINTKIVIIG